MIKVIQATRSLTCPYCQFTPTNDGNKWDDEFVFGGCDYGFDDTTEGSIAYREVRCPKCEKKWKEYYMMKFLELLDT